jgi:hypothetical protein
MSPVEYNEEERLRPGQAYGGLVGYAEGGVVDKDDPMAAYGAQGSGIGIPTEAPDIKSLEPAKPPAPPSSIMGDILGLAKTAASIYAASDARMKDNIEQVGELYDGQPVYRYNMKGSSKTQLGLMAQDLEHNGHGDAVAGLGGVKMVDYKRATDVAAGLAPREGFQRGGMPDEDYAIRTIAAEASGKSPEEARAIAHVIENRRASGRWGETYGDVVRAPKQFEPWSNSASPNYPMRFSPDSPRYQMAREALAAARGGEDITGGAMHFYAPTAQAQLAASRGDRAPVPSWARNREYVDFGPTRIVRDVDDPRASGLMAYAGQPQQGEGARSIDRAAGAPQGLGQARPPVSEPAAPTSQERSALAGMLPVKFGTRTVANPKGEEFGGVGEFLTSRQFVQPLLEGIGAMASSQSLSGVGAALQGLGAASKAYTGLEKEMAGAQTEGEQARFVQAQTDAARVQTQGATLKNFEGRIIILVRGPDGKPQWVDFQDRGKYEPYIPAAGEKLPEPKSSGVTGAGQIRQGNLSTRKEPAAKTEGTEAAGVGAAETAAEAPKTPAPFRGTNPLTFDQSLEERARQEARTMERETNVTLSSRKDMVEETNRAAAAASAEKKIMLELGVLASTPGGFLSQGALLPYKLKLAKVANDIVGREVFDEKDLARFEAWEKKLTELSASAARSGDQTAVEALSRLRTMYPSPEQSQPGAAKNAAEVLIRNQQRIDEARLLNQYHDVIRGQTSRLSSRFDPSVRDLIDKKYENIYVKDRQALERMLDSSTGPSDPRTGRRMTDAQGKPMSWFTFLQKNGSRVDDEFVKQIEQRFNAPGIMRYFQTGG